MHVGRRRYSYSLIKIFSLLLSVYRVFMKVVLKC